MEIIVWEMQKNKKNLICLEILINDELFIIFNTDYNILVIGYIKKF